MGLILLIILIILLIGAIPAWPYSRGWGYNPLIIVAIIFIVILILVFTNVITFWNTPTNVATNKTEVFRAPSSRFAPDPNRRAP